MGNINPFASSSFIEPGKLSEFKVDEPAATVGGIATINFPIPPSFSDLAAVSLTVDECTDRVWLNGTVHWSGVFTAAGIISATFQLLRGTTVVYQTIQDVVSPVAGTVDQIVHLEHIDLPLVSVKTMLTYTLRAQANVTGASTNGPITLTASELEANNC